ncbi:hypothetical protein ES288_D12G161100v1 [Gossypium darwinii]|uniref:Uncharacterized protein n=1 Tax=Gossypium darwinii TaxID=34276 RepID=A0A5D2AAF8_GOSDA|nr:hypothetical protein ES288_D12G161100v1 [Gossypium darwinii]
MSSLISFSGSLLLLIHLPQFHLSLYLVLSQQNSVNACRGFCRKRIYYLILHY